MLRPLLFLLTAASVAVAAPPPKGADKKAELYLPTTVGTKWVLEIKSGDTTTESTMTVTKVEEKDGVFRVTTETASANAGGRRPTEMTHEVSEKGLFVVARGGKDLPTPLPQLKLPAKKGDVWSPEPTIQYTVGETAEVQVPAGKFQATPVERTEPGADGGAGFSSTLWFAPGVGMVKSVVKIRDRELTTVLKSFTPAAAAKTHDLKK